MNINKEIKSQNKCFRALFRHLCWVLWGSFGALCFIQRFHDVYINKKYSSRILLCMTSYIIHHTYTISGVYPNLFSSVFFFLPWMLNISSKCVILTCPSVGACPLPLAAWERRCGPEGDILTSSTLTQSEPRLQRGRAAAAAAAAAASHLIKGTSLIFQRQRGVFSLSILQKQR